MPEKYKKFIQRRGHGAATLTVNSHCVEVILFGGYDKNYSLMANTTILKLVSLLKKRGTIIQVDTVKLVKEASFSLVSSKYNIVAIEHCIIQCSIATMPKHNTQIHPGSFELLEYFEEIAVCCEHVVFHFKL